MIPQHRPRSIDHGSIREHLSRILDSPTFRKCPDLKRFLTYTIEQTLAGRENEIKEYTIAVEALRRDASFDPAADPIVRVQARNLRQRLDDYYKTAGAQDTLRIAYPLGDYKPTFSSEQPGPAKGESIGVIPITARSVAAYLSDGLSEEVIRKLKTSRDLRVIAYGSALGLKKENLSEQTVGKVLNVSNVLQGSLAEHDKTYQIRMTLLDTATGLEKWHNSYSFYGDNHSSAVAHIAQNVAIDVANAIARPLPVIQGDCFHNKTSELYLRAKYLWATRKVLKVRKAIEHLETAIGLEPSNARFRSTLAAIYCTIALYSAGKPGVFFNRAREFAERARSLDDGNAEAHLVLGVIASVYDWNHEAADAHFEAAREREPTNPLIHRWKGVFHFLPRRLFDDCLRSLNTARDCEPVLDLVFTDIAGVHNARKDHEQALVYCDIASENNPHSFRAYWMRGLTLECQGDLNGAIDQFKKARRYSGSKLSSHLVRGSLAHAYAKAGKPAKAWFHLTAMQSGLAFGVYASSYDFAIAYAGLNDMDNAFACLQQALEDRCTGLTFMAVDPRWDRYRELQWFRDVLSKRFDGNPPSFDPIVRSNDR